MMKEYLGIGSLVLLLSCTGSETISKNEPVQNKSKTRIPAYYQKKVDALSENITGKIPLDTLTKELWHSVPDTSELRKVVETFDEDWEAELAVRLANENKVPVGDFISMYEAMRSKETSDADKSDTIIHLDNFLRKGGNADRLEKILSLKNAAEMNVVTNGNLISELHESTDSLGYLEELLDVKYHHGMTVFGALPGDDLLKAAKSKISPEYAQKVADKGNFEPKDIIEFSELGTTVEEIERWQAITLNDFRAAKYIRFGLTEENVFEFKDTEKPNAYVVFPEHDYNGAFDTKAAKDLINGIIDAYDTKFIIAKDEDELLKGMENIPSIDLLVPSGHGNGNSIQLGSIWNAEPDSTEKVYLDSDDYDEVYKMTRKLTNNSAVFLNSCSAAETDSLESIAPFIEVYAGPGTTVYAARESFAIDQVKVKSFYPFDIQILRRPISVMGEFLPKDITWKE